MQNNIKEDEVESKFAREFISTPYKQSKWEGFELVDKNPTFKKIAVEVIVNEELSFDPLFEQFDFNERLARQKSEEFEEIEIEEPIISEEILEDIRLQAFDEGVEEGKKQALSESQLQIVEKYEALAESMKNISNQIKDELNKRVDELEQNAFRLALDISKKLVFATAEAKPEYILDVIRNGLKHLGSSKPMKVRVSPADFEFLEVVGLPEDLTMEGAKIQYVPDELITYGCVVETDYGELNLELDRMWTEVKDSLFKAVS
jgi:flagellar assembly protein FliH